MLKRFLLAALAVTALVPTGAHAASTTYAAPFVAGPRGGDAFNFISADTASGRASVFRLQPPIPGGSLGCAGKGGFATFEVRGITDPVASVRLDVDEAFWNPFTWVTLSVVAETGPLTPYFLGTEKVRGPGAASASITLDIDPVEQVAPGVSQTIRFGLEVASSCTPAIDGGTVRFAAVSVETV